MQYNEIHYVCTKEMKPGWVNARIWKTYILYSLYYVACLVCQSASQTSMESLHAEEVLVKMFEVKKLFNQVGCTCRSSIFEDEFKGKSCMLSHELLPHVSYRLRYTILNNYIYISGSMCPCNVCIYSACNLQNTTY